MTLDKVKSRKAAFARRKLANEAGLDSAAQDALRAALAPHAGRVLAGYMAIRTEVDPLPVMTEWRAPVCVPVIQGAGMPLLFRRWAPGCKMIQGPFGVMVPAVAEVVVPEVLIVPLVAFNSEGYRLGYGGGFYDRTLEGLRARGQIVAYGFAYDGQFVERLPLEATDQRLDGIITETGMVGQP